MQVFVDSYVNTGDKDIDHKEKKERVSKWKADHPGAHGINSSDESD